MQEHDAARRLARRSDPSTSHDAAARTAAFRNAQKDRILAKLRDDGQAGAEEIGDDLGMDGYAVRKRLADLEHAQLAVPTGMQRQTRSGRWERIWRAA